MLTVLIPAYNNLKTLRRTVKHLGEQTIAQNLTIIISDDCSPKLSLEELNTLKETHESNFQSLVVYKQEHNLGVMSNKEWLYNHVSTEYFAFHEHDDWIINPHFYETALKYLAEETDACCFFGNAIIQPPNTPVNTAEEHRSNWMYRVDDKYSEQQKGHMVYTGLRIVRSLIDSSMEKPFNTSWTSLVIRKKCVNEIGGFAGNYALTKFETNLLKVYREEEHFAFIYFMATKYCFILEHTPSVVRGFDINAYSRSPNNPARKLKQDSSFYAFYKLVYFIDKNIATSKQKEGVMLELLRHCIKLGIIEKNNYTDDFIESYRPKLDTVNQLIPVFTKKSKRYD